MPWSSARSRSLEARSSGPISTSRIWRGGSGCSLRPPVRLIHRAVFNVGFQNRTVAELAELVRRQVGDPSVSIVVRPTDDLRSYHINADRIRAVLGVVL